MLVFLLMLFRVFRLGRAEVERIKRLPLDADSERRTVLEDCDGAGEDKLLDHDYDGIRELDNDLPRGGC